MKIWFKMYLFSIILFSLIFWITVFIIIETFHNNTLTHQVTNSLNEHQNIYNGINMDIPAYEKLQRYSRDTLSSTQTLVSSFNVYASNYNSDNFYLELYNDKQEVIFSNTNFIDNISREDLNNLKPNTRQYIIKDIGDRSYIFISSILKFSDDNYYFSCIYDLTNIYDERIEQYDFTLKLYLCFLVVFMFLMFIISNFLTKPLSKLTQATIKITKGKYSERVSVRSGDEIGILADNFNHMADEISNKIDKLQEQNNEKQRFIENLAHELRTPLTSIIGYADFLQRSKYDEKVFYEGLEYIHNEGKRLQQLSFKLMDLLLIKKDSFEFRKYAIKDICSQSIGILRPKFLEKSINIKLTGDDFDCYMEHDLMQVLFINLIENAIRASYEDSKIIISIDSINQQVTITDYGIGMDQENIDKIFEPFYMIDKSRTRSENGAGLGLALCSKIAEFHNIKIDVTSELNKGTSIVLIFSNDQGGNQDA
ncbi:HAMP domain-containing sensor histidine kinase [Vallitalea sediminicola]